MLLASVTSLSLLLGAANNARAEKIEVNLEELEFDVPDDQKTLFGYDSGQGRAFFYAGGVGESTITVTKEGEYRVTVNASCQAAEGENAKFKLKMDEIDVGEEKELKSEDADDYTFLVKLKAGKHKLGIEFTNDKYKEGEYDLNFFVHAITLQSK